MEIGVSISPKGDLVENIEKALDSADFVEIPIGEQERDIKKLDSEEIRTVLDEKGYRVITHLPFSQPVVTRIEEFNQAEVDYLKRVLSFSSEIGAEKAILHPNIRYREDEDIEDAFREQLEKLDEIAEKNGVELCVENMPPQINSASNDFELAEILEELGISMCFDTGHGFASMEQEEMEEFLEEYSVIISHLHLQDTREGKDLHLPVGSAEIDFKALGEKLSDFEGTATMEVFTGSNDYLELSREKVQEYFQ